MKKKWAKTGVNVCSRTVRNQLNEMEHIEKSQMKTSTNTQEEENEVKVG